MNWKIEDRPEAVVVTMQSNPVNKQNPDYFNDVHAAFDELDRNFPGKPVILTAERKIFSAGIDFDYCFPMFQRRDIAEVRNWFNDYKKSMLRIFAAPRMTIAAVNGHAFAGGLILALSCDFRIGARGDFRFALNEVPIGIPMPSAYTELIRFRLGNKTAIETILLGQPYSVEDSLQNGLLTSAVSAEKLVESALHIAGLIPAQAWPAYVQSKKVLMHPVLTTIENLSPQLDEETYKVMIAPESLEVHAQIYERLKKKKGT